MAPFDPARVEAISGKVLRVERTGPNGRGVHLLVGTDHGAVMVHVGPAWYLDEQGLSLQPGDVVRLDVYPVDVDGSSFAVAKRIEKGGKVFLLRNEAGVPLWSGRGRRR